MAKCWWDTSKITAKQSTCQLRRMIREACKNCEEINCRGCRFPKPAKEVGLKIERTKEGVKIRKLW